MGLKNYIKKGIRYVVYDHKPQQVYVRTSTISPSEMFKNKVVLVTGGSSGIGLSIAKRFYQEGADVIITGRNEENLKKAVEGTKIDYIVNDVKDINQHDKLLDMIQKKYKKIDILINNAGISNHEKDFLSVTEKDFDEQFEINLKGSYFLTQNFIKRIIDEKNKNYNIIFVSSERGAQCDVLPYGLTKNALNALIKGLSCCYVESGIRINGIAPGVTVSNLNKLDKTGDLYSDKYVSGRCFIPEEVAEIALFLASDYAKCISGEIIYCNDGNHLNAYHSLKKCAK